MSGLCARNVLIAAPTSLSFPYICAESIIRYPAFRYLHRIMRWLTSSAHVTDCVVSLPEVSYVPKPRRWIECPSESYTERMSAPWIGPAKHEAMNYLYPLSHCTDSPALRIHLSRHSSQPRWGKSVPRKCSHNHWVALLVQCCFESLFKVDRAATLCHEIVETSTFTSTLACQRCAAKLKMKFSVTCRVIGDKKWKRTTPWLLPEPIGPLHGLPLSVKEHLWIKGLPCNMGWIQNHGRQTKPWSPFPGESLLSPRKSRSPSCGMMELLWLILQSQGLERSQGCDGELPWPFWAFWMETSRSCKGMGNHRWIILHGRCRSRSQSYWGLTGINRPSHSLHHHRNQTRQSPHHHWSLGGTAVLILCRLIVETHERDAYREKYWNYFSGNPNRPDVILCPVGPVAASKMDMARYWGYTSIWNVLDYPTAILPVSQIQEKEDSTREQILNEQDAWNWKQCMHSV